MRTFAFLCFVASLQMAQADLTTKDPTIGPEFGYVLAVVVCICMQCSFVIIGAAGPRYKHFTPEFVAKSLQAENDELKKLAGYELGKGCHPDNGLGRLASKLPMDAWMEINIAQRAAGNYMEGLVPIVVFLLVTGLFAPIPASCVGAFYLFARQMYVAGFKSSKGPGARAAWFGPIMLSQMGLFASSLFFSLRMTGALSALGM